MTTLKAFGQTFAGETKLHAFAEMKQAAGSAELEALLEKADELASRYITEAHREEVENAGWNDDVFGKYCTDELLLKCFEEIVKDNQAKFRGKVYFEEV